MVGTFALTLRQISQRHSEGDRPDQDRHEHGDNRCRQRRYRRTPLGPPDTPPQPADWPRWDRLVGEEALQIFS
ncbi:MAG: hypothetical protein NZO58_11545 [Gemmataceae bacterium]|nr:hypothetical protein [Gemmataceae bacterium]